MIFRLAWRSLVAHPVRTLVLACGFGLGVGVMATLLGVGEVILEQAQSPAIEGGGDVVIASAAGRLTSGRWLLSSALKSDALGPRIAAASPARRAALFLVKDGRTVPIRVRAGIPSLERAVGDPETSAAAGWVDSESDRAWRSPDPGSALKALDRFHPIPDVPLRADSWAEWLYFNGRTNDARFYLTFLVGPRRDDGTRIAGVRLQLERGGEVSSYSDAAAVADADVLRDAPELTVGENRVRVDGLRYQITVDLPAERRGAGAGSRDTDAASRLRGTISIEAVAGRALPPLTIRGAAGWVSGYVVPVMSGKLGGTLNLGGQAIALDGGEGYHDHNWGFWKGVSWQWGQVQYGDLSVIYGRVHPPADAADPERIPGFLAALGPDGPLAYSADVSIEEVNDPVTDVPRTIVVSGRGPSLDLTMNLDVENRVSTRMGDQFFGGGLDFLQLRARYRVVGHAGDRAIDFTAPGSAETFRGR
jgi:hypothetical protein